MYPQFLENKAENESKYSLLSPIDILRNNIKALCNEAIVIEAY